MNRKPLACRIILACVAVILAEVGNADAQPTPLDTAAIARAVLAAEQTPDSGISQLVGTMRCADPSEVGTNRGGKECRASDLQELLTEFADRHGAEVVDSDAAPQVCSWNDETNAKDAGLRVHLIAPFRSDGEVLAGVWTTCRGRRGGFIYIVHYVLEFTDDQWRVVRVKSTMIT